MIKIEGDIGTLVSNLVQDFLELKAVNIWWREKCENRNVGTTNKYLTPVAARGLPILVYTSLKVRLVAGGL